MLALPYRPSLTDVQAQSISTPLPTCYSESTTADAWPVYESGPKLLKAFMALTPAFEGARGKCGHDPELQSHIDTRGEERKERWECDGVAGAVDVAICGYHKDVSMQQDICRLQQLWHILLQSGLWQLLLW